MFDLLHNPELAGILMRVPVGLFFAIRGGQKVFSKDRHKALMRTIEADGYSHVAFWAWWIPVWELISGSLLVMGIGIEFNAAVLGLICLVALLTDKVEEVRVKRQPATKCDWLCCIIYCSEVPMGLILTALILS